MSKTSYLSNQKLWRIIKQPDGYYYEIKLAGMVVDRFKIPKDSAITGYGVVKDEPKK